MNAQLIILSLLSKKIALKKRFSRRLLFILSILALLIVLFQFVRLPFIPLRLHEAVPSGTSVFLSFPNLQEAVNLKDSYGNILFAEKINTDLEEIKQHLQLPADEAWLAVLHSPDFSFLYIFKKGDKPDDLSSFNTSKFRGKTIYELNSKGDFFFAEFRNLVLCARSRIRVEEGVSQLKSYPTNLQKNRNFRRVNRFEHPDAMAYVYLNFTKLKMQFSKFLGLKRENALQDFGKWTDKLKLALIPSENGLLLEGAVEGNLSFLSNSGVLIHDQFLDYLPDNTAVYTRMQAPLVGAFSSDFQKFFTTWFAGEIIYLNAEPGSTASKDHKYMLLKSNSAEVAAQSLKECAEALGSPDRFEYGMFEAQKIMTEDILRPVFGKKLNPLRNPYYVVLEEYVLFAQSAKAIRTYLDHYLAGKVLQNDVNYQGIHSSGFANENLTFGLNFGRLEVLLQQWLEAEYRKDFSEFYANYETLSDLRLTLKPEGRQLRLKGKVADKESNTELGNTKSEEDAELLWRSESHTEAQGKPSFLYSEKQQRNLLVVQDKANKLHAFSEEGNILWTRQLDGKIKSEFYPLPDRDGKETVIFNTSSKIYRIDYSGGDYEAFPLVTGKEIINGLSLINFDSGPERNIFVACKNKRIYAYNSNGRPLKNWKPSLKTGRIYHKLGYIEGLTKDYIFGVNDKAELCILNRAGEELTKRVKLDDAADFPPYAHSFQPEAGQEFIVSANRNRTIDVISITGVKKSYQFEEISEDFRDFTALDLDGDNKNEFVALGEKTLFFFDIQEGRPVLSKTEVFFHNIDTFSKTNTGFAMLDKQGKLIYAYDVKGDLIPGFPLGGNTLFSVNEGNSRVFTGCEGGVCLYRLSNN